MTGEQFWLAFVGVLAWPAAMVVLVLLALAFALPDQRAEVLRALAEVVRAVRGGAGTQVPPSPAGTDETRLERSSDCRPDP